jgi:4-amino-4-deoxy-L-arabinose transferase-like glycosyltransferase
LAFTFPLDIDAKTYSYVAERILEGAMPYRDAWDHKPPGILYLYAAVFWLIGVKPWAVIGTKLLLDAATFGVLHAVMRRLYDRPTALVVTVLCAVFSSGIVLQRMSLQAEHPMLLFASLCLWYAIRGLDDARARWLFVSGACLGLAATFKQTAVIMLAGPVAMTILSGPGNGGEGPSRAARRSAWFLMGAIVPVLAWTIYFWWRGALLDLWLTIPFNAAYGRTSVAKYLVSNAVEGATYFAEQWFLWMLAAVWVWFVVSDGPDRSDGTVLGWLLGSVIVLALLGNFYAQYVIALVPALTAAAGAVLVRLWREFERVRARWPSGQVVCAILVAGFVGLFVAKQLRVYSLVEAERAAREQLAPISAMVEGVAAGEAYCWGINLLCWRTPAPTRFFYQYPLLLVGNETVRNALGVSAIGEALTRIEARKPEIIVVEHLELRGLDTGPPAALVALLEREYRRDLQVVTEGGGLVVDVHVRAGSEQ